MTCAADISIVVNTNKVNKHDIVLVLCEISIDKSELFVFLV